MNDNKVEFLHIPQRECTQVIVENGWVKIKQISQDSSEIWLTFQDAYMVSNYLRKAASFLKRGEAE